jgi:hypothetical protein
MKDIFIEKEEVKINQAIYTFSLAMTDKMLLKLAEGYRGWDKSYNEDSIRTSLKLHIHKGLEAPNNLVDIANFCMMLHRFKTQERKEDKQ